MAEEYKYLNKDITNLNCWKVLEGSQTASTVVPKQVIKFVDLLSVKHCEALIKEAENMSNTLSNASSEYNISAGIHISKFGFLRFAADLATEFSTNEPVDVFSKLKIHEAFYPAHVYIIKNNGTVARPIIHRDDIDLTMNICLGGDFKGGEFVGSDKSVIPQKQGTALVYGNFIEGNNPLEGHSYNLIVYFKRCLSFNTFASLPEEMSQRVLLSLDIDSLLSFSSGSKKTEEWGLSIVKRLLSSTEASLLNQPYFKEAKTLRRKACIYSQYKKESKQPEAFHRNWKRLELILREIIQTEKMYLDTLECAQAVATKSKKMMSKKNHSILFSGIDGITECSRSIIQVFAAHDISTKELPMLYSLLMELYNKCHLKFHPYQKFVKDYGERQKVMTKLQNKSKFTSCVSAIKPGFTIESIMVCPVSRIPRYMLLVKELQKWCGPCLQAIFAKIKNQIQGQANVINQAVRDQTTPLTFCFALQVNIDDQLVLLSFCGDKKIVQSGVMVVVDAIQVKEGLCIKFKNANEIKLVDLTKNELNRILSWFNNNEYGQQSCTLL